MRRSPQGRLIHDANITHSSSRFDHLRRYRLVRRDLPDRLHGDVERPAVGADTGSLHVLWGVRDDLSDAIASATRIRDAVLAAPRPSLTNIGRSAERGTVLEILRTPDDRFSGLPGFDYEPKYIEIDGWRMHRVDVGSGDPILCLHGEPSWSYLYRKMIPLLSERNRVIAPDLFGFGRSDKPKERSAYTFEMHLNSVKSFIEALDLSRITLVCQDWGGLLGLTAAAQMPERFARIVAMNTGLPTGEEKTPPAFLAWRQFAATVEDMEIGRLIQAATTTDLDDAVIAAYDAPFPDGTYKAGAHQFPLLVPISTDDPGSAPMRQAREVYKSWTKPFLTLFSDQDPITAGADRWFRRLVPTASQEPEITIQGGGHFLQEDRGEEIARHIQEFIDRRPIPA